MDKSDLWRCGAYYLQCAWYLDNVVNQGETGCVRVLKNKSEFLTCTLYKHHNSDKTFATFFEQGRNRPAYSQSRHKCYTAFEWGLVLKHQEDIKWFDTGMTQDFFIELPDVLEPVEPSPNITKWSQRQFASDSYNFLCKTIRDQEEGDIEVNISAHKIMSISINKRWGLRPYSTQ